MSENQYDDLSKEALQEKIRERNGEKKSGDEGYIPTSGDKETLKSRLVDDDKGTTTPSDGVGQPTKDHDAAPTAGTGGGASTQGSNDGSEEDDVELSKHAGDPATAEQTQLQLLEQHGASEEAQEQAEEIQDSLDERRDEARSRVKTVDDDEAKAIFDHNTGVPLFRRNTEDLTEAQKKAPSDFPTPDGDGAVDYSEEHQAAADAEREKKNSSLPKFDDRVQYDDDVTIGDELKTERQGASGRGDVLRSDDEDGTPKYVGGAERSVYVPDDDTTWREIATLLDLPRPQELAFINGRYDGTELVTKGTKVLLPDGYTFS